MLYLLAMPFPIKSQIANITSLTLQGQDLGLCRECPDTQCHKLVVGVCPRTFMMLDADHEGSTKIAGNLIAGLYAILIA